MQGERPSNSQLGEARVSQLPIAREWLRHVLHTRLFPLLESRFGIQAQDLTLQDSLIIGYGYFGKGAESQPVHRDSSLLSLTVALSPSTQYTGGGGTYFEGLDQVLFSEQGHVICHASGTPHAGRGIASGCERYVLVLFVLCKDNPELARRCRAQGIRLGEEGKHEEAKLAFETGLELAPKDHLLWISLGSVYMQQGNFLRARACLSTAASCYPYCLRSAMGLARMHLENRKPRAALRRFNRVLDWLNDRDLRDDLEWKPWRQFGWEARVFGSQAALVCAQEAKRANMQDFDCKTNIELAKTRLRATLQTGQDDVRTLGLLKFADSLQDDINEPT
jgi:tetratricopeptide (TPR) repeat protein